MINTIFVATGKCIPEINKNKLEFLENKFYVQENGRYILDPKLIRERVQQLSEITGIEDRRYAREDQNSSDLGVIALKDTGCDVETLDEIIVATNFGDIDSKYHKVNNVPSIASRIKNKLGIKNPRTKAYDITYGCPGWLEGVIQAHQKIQGGYAKKIAVIGTEILSRVCDPHDMDSMIYADGSGAVILKAQEGRKKEGILSFSSRTDADFSEFLTMGPSNNPDYSDKERLFLKMQGKKLFAYAKRNVPEVIHEAIKEAGITLADLNMILIHQANERLDNEILEKMNLSSEQIKKLTPMTIKWLGNSSVATLPTLMDLVFKYRMMDYFIDSNELILLASVGAGMNRNAVIYKMPDY